MREEAKAKTAERLCREIGKKYPGTVWGFYGGHYRRNEAGEMVMDDHEIPVVTVPGLCDIELDRAVTLTAKLSRERALGFDYAALGFVDFEAYGVEDWLSDYYHPGMSLEELRRNIAESGEKEIFFSFTVEEQEVRSFVERLGELGFYY